MKVAKRLDNWKKAFLSRGGCLTLIQLVLDSLPVYYMSMFRIPIGVTGEIEEIMRDFLWEGFCYALGGLGLILQAQGIRRIGHWKH